MELKLRPKWDRGGKYLVICWTSNSLSTTTNGCDHWLQALRCCQVKDCSHRSRWSFELPSHFQRIDWSRHSVCFENSILTLGLRVDSGGRFNDKEIDEFIKSLNGYQSQSSLLSNDSPRASTNVSRSRLDTQQKERLDFRFSSEGGDQDFRESGIFINRIYASMPSPTEIDDRAFQSAHRTLSSQNIVGQGGALDQVEQQRCTGCTSNSSGLLRTRFDSTQPLHHRASSSGISIHGSFPSDPLV